ncbi:MAG: tetratricopeptide repeat protein [Bryobacterales bacterium]|nr:tetratricopeptide repeat protein [Bryobacterales bacterium]
MKSNKRNPEPAKPIVPAAPPPPPAGISWWWGPALAILAVVAYLPALRGPFLFDDLGLPALRPDGGESMIMYVRRVVRLVTNVSLAFDRIAWDMNPVPYHVQNLLLHCVNGWLVYLIVRRLLARIGAEARTASLAAFAACSIFLLHPLQTEAVSYIASRSEVLCALFTYAAIAIFLRKRENGIGWGSAIGILVLMGLGILSKEPAVAGIVAILLIDLLLAEGSPWRAAAANWRLYLPTFAAAAIGGLYALQIAGREGTAGALRNVTPLDYLVTQFQVFWIYVRLFFLPVGQNLDHGYPMAKAPGGLGSALGFIGLLALLAGVWLWRKRYPLASLGVLIFLVLLAPTSSILPIADALVERRVYLGSLGLVLIIAEFAARMNSAQLRTAGIGVLAVLLTVFTMNRNSVYASAQAMWEDSVRGNPTNARSQNQLAYAYYIDGRCAEAATAYERAMQLTKADHRTLVDWGLALDCAGKPDLAVAKLREATALGNHWHAWTTLGMLLGKQGQTQPALEALNKAIAINPGDDNAFAYRGNVRLAAGDKAPAIADFEKSLQLNPSNAAARRGIAVAQGQ